MYDLLQEKEQGKSRWRSGGVILPSEIAAELQAYGITIELPPG
jgi:hypothetical protein